MEVDDIVMDVLIEARHIDKALILKSKKPFEARSGIYCLISENEIVYIGQSIDIMSRISIHTKTKEFDSYATISCPLPWRNILEAHLIVQFNPKYNESIPANPLYQGRDKIMNWLSTNQWHLKKYIKEWDIKPVWNGHFRTLDFENFGEEWQANEQQDPRQKQ